MKESHCGFFLSLCYCLRTNSLSKWEVIPQYYYLYFFISKQTTGQLAWLGSPIYKDRIVINFVTLIFNQQPLKSLKNYMNSCQIKNRKKMAFFCETKKQ